MSGSESTAVSTVISQELQDSGARLTKPAIASIVEQMSLAEDMVSTLLKLGVDYGITPGTQGPGLWDPGAAKIIRSFRCHAEHKVLFHEETDDLISWTIEAQLISSAGEIVGSGLGNASTRETKYKYRWVEKNDALREGYTAEDIAELKTKTYNDTTKYRIANPECGELANTLLQMASKRAECDAAKSLPGVGSALRAKFDTKPSQKSATTPATAAQNEDLSLSTFWGIIKGAGVTEDETHKILRVKSLKDWVADGKTLREAVIVIMAAAVQQAKIVGKAQAPSEKKAPDVQVLQKTKKQITKADIPDVTALLHWVDVYFHMTEDKFFPAIGYSDRQGFLNAGVQSPFEAWQSLLEQNPN